ncbi:rRNA-processing protein LAS1 KNAG_0C01170 [Huiozyma naganishii CBS 8797]|uniref:Uncharacterized protein n=1 Tax=Huiozyma naganishii (strain ATCC MYA-139 / BCRC 22969 / CBS 8797 / KCTC 17520 / NBRC 10181 / NCYC 3082 / Yp74L-3) TaxID=1071383 RepID=J7R320_HUIN7|nr:hypothetical protein KNAG_0C01170 [Kazachstania naganishii CBS 8797]CCK69230.1 hypothetical protein KNAG_0C01170 [Kazachstania naganishii CBS 8797]
MVHARIVPWADKKELDELKYWFYSDEERLQLRAINKVKSYKSKGSQYLPHVIESTAQLTNVLIMDKKSLYSDDISREINARLMYTMTLIRFVNGILDPNQRSQFAIPLHTIAKNVGLSSWFVDLRHWGTHERELPGLDMLRIASKEALSWLRDHYWEDNELEESMSEGEEAENTDAEDETEKATGFTTEQLKELISSWPSFSKDFLNNKSMWTPAKGKKLISSESFTVEDHSEIEKSKTQRKIEANLDNYVQSWRNLWRASKDKARLVSICLSSYSPLLTQVLICKLDQFLFHTMDQILKIYQTQISSLEDTKITALEAHYPRLDNLHRELLNVLLKYSNIKLITSQYKDWMDLIRRYRNTLSLELCTRLLNLLSRQQIANDDWRNNKKRKWKNKSNEGEFQDSLVEVIGVLRKETDISKEKAAYERRLKSKCDEKTANQDLITDLSADDILADLQRLKQKMQSTLKEDPAAQDPVPIKKWERCSNWTPKPFGTI